MVGENDRSGIIKVSSAVGPGSGSGWWKIWKGVASVAVTVVLQAWECFIKYSLDMSPDTLLQEVKVVHVPLLPLRYLFSALPRLGVAQLHIDYPLHSHALSLLA